MMINSMQKFSCQLPFQIKEIRTSISRFHTNNTPSCYDWNKKQKRKKKENKANQKISNKRKMLRKNDLKEPNEMIHRFMMPFTRVPFQSDKREESSGLILSSQQQENSK
jgi:hypothetical protein